MTASAELIVLKPSIMRSDSEEMYTNEYVCSLIVIPRNLSCETCSASNFYSSKSGGYTYQGLVYKSERGVRDVLLNLNQTSAGFIFYE